MQIYVHGTRSHPMVPEPVPTQLVKKPAAPRLLSKAFPHIFQTVVHSFALLFHLKWVPAGARRPQNQSRGGQVQPQTEFSSNLHRFLTPFREPWGCLGPLLSSLGRPRVIFSLFLNDFRGIFSRNAFSHRFGPQNLRKKLFLEVRGYGFCIINNEVW